MSSRAREQAVDPLVARFLGAVVLLVVLMLMGLELYLGHLQVGGHVVAMLLLGVSAWSMFVPVLRRILGPEGAVR